jgi:acyl-coenzyme A synthetase/AMP-(fatty) acid ligase
MVPWRQAQLCGVPAQIRIEHNRVGDDRPAILFCAEPDIPGVCQVLTRAELVDRVNRVATAMRRLGVQQGDRVAGYLPNRVETAIAFRGYFAEIRN